LEAERAAEQEEIDNAVDLTEEEKAEKEELQGLGFGDWNKREYLAFIKGMEMYGRCVFFLFPFPTLLLLRRY
jgi:SWI/SNF-related matrix-associated actin-dependent regulator of chromatin subfamily A member 5